jgi:hypothetical protein
MKKFNGILKDVDIVKLNKNIFWLKFPTKYLLTSTMLRFEEYYESPEFHDKIFDIEEYTDWYVSKKGKFSYYEDWSGFNIPGDTLRPFINNAFNPLSRKEQSIVYYFEDIEVEKIYIIATLKSEKIGVIKHEIAHAFYYTNDDYKYKIDSLLISEDLSKMYVYLEKLGYSDKVFIDETQAYLISDPTKDFKKLQKELRIVFNKYYEPLRKKL